uniref:NADH dehydrogenase subunit 3 n=1 Tax=Gergithus yunnanensis TaxID=1898278 RepID=UPI002E76433B|nr:NADH dehydrogenase subunit 3 [Gergithus yunnanensis]WQB38536.1 NADH dehydrogenase subunit 3 [Gergithus yunnanensis]
MKIIVSTLMMVTIINIFLLLTMAISKKTKMSREKNSPFECGFSPMSSTRKPFSIQFFLMATMFLIFDIEISVILPMTSTKMTNMMEWITTSSMTITILMMGLMHEWKSNMLEWTK